MKPSTKVLGRWILRLALSGVFIYAGVAKIRDPRAFAESIASFQLLPAAFIDPAALTLPALEIVVAMLSLTFGRMRRVGAFGLLALLMVFLAAFVSAQWRGIHVDCGCFGADRLDVLSPTKDLWVALGRDVVFAGIAAVLYATALPAANSGGGTPADPTS